MKIRILVLGGNGFIGSHLVDALVAEGSRIRVFARSENHYSQPERGVDYQYGDFADSVKVAEALVDVDVVVHMISTTVPATANMDPAADIKGNLLPTISLLQQMRDLSIPRIVFLSSGGTVYGNTNVTPIPESHERNPLSSYGIVKAAIENYIAMFSLQYGIQPLVLRVSNPYGPRQGHFGIQGVIATFFQRIVSGEEIRIWGDGSNVRDYLYIDDLVSFLVKSIKEGLSGVYNVGSGKGATLLDVMSLVSEVSGFPLNVKHLPPRGFDVKNVVLDISKACEAINWAPSVSLRQGCELYWEWLKEKS